MTELRLEGQTWTFQDTKKELETREILAQVFAKEIEENRFCRNSEDPEWRTVRERFQFLGPYALLKRLGEGAFGVVYLGVNAKRLKEGKSYRLVALKSPTDALLDRFVDAAGRKPDPKLSERENQIQARMWARLQLGNLFSKEAALTARFAQCENVVNVIDHDVTVPYLALEYCNGGSLGRRLKRPYSYENVISWGIQLCSALKVAHSLDPVLIHRDLKPENVLIHDNVLKISDLGTSQLLDETSSLKSLKGGFTPAYASPEALDGGAVPATDIWSFGVMLYEMLGGTRPFVGESAISLMKSIALDKPRSLKEASHFEISDSLDEFVVRGCLAKDPKERMSAEEVKDFLISLNRSFHFMKTQPLTIATDLDERAISKIDKRSCEGVQEPSTPKRRSSFIQLVTALISTLFIWGAVAAVGSAMSTLFKDKTKRSDTKKEK